MAQIRQLILTSTDPIASMNGVTSSGGRLNANKVLRNGDAAPPSRVTSLAIADTGSTCLALAWTAPGDDSTAGTATRYDLRTSASPIDSINFASATPIVLPSPQTGGATEIAQIAGLAFSTRYHFALRAFDDFGNAGPVSNDAAATTLGIPRVSLAPQSIKVLLVPEASVVDTVLFVSNIGQGRLDFTVSPSTPTAWLTVTPDSGRIHAPNAVRVGLHVDATGLTGAGYDATLQVVGNDPLEPIASVPLHLLRDVSAVDDALPASFHFRILSPRPGTRRVALELSMPRSGPADVSLFDVRGRRVARLARGTLSAGTHTLHWDGTDEDGRRIVSGVYFARARTREGASSLRVVIVE
jgi:hypothetical protein